MSLVTFENDYIYGTKLLKINGFPISFTKLSDKEIESYNRRSAKPEPEEDPYYSR